MTSGYGLRLASLPLRLKLPLLLAGPLLVLGGFAAAWLAGWLGPPRAAEIHHRAGRLTAWFESQMHDALLLTASAFEDEPPAHLSSLPLARRLEGVGVLDENFNYISWSGTPPEPSPTTRGEGSPAWQVRLDGVRTRLIVRAGPETDGRFALASFIVDSRLPERSFGRWVPEPLRRGVDLSVRFVDYAAWRQGLETLPEAGPREGAVALDLRAPDDTPLAVGTLTALSTSHAEARIRGVAVAWALALLLVLAALLFDWSAASASPAGLVATAACVTLGRLALARAHAAAWLLPRDLGTASVFGTPRAWGLAGSPGALFLTAFAVYLVALAARRCCTRAGVRPGAGLGLVVAGSLAGMTALGGMLVTLARNSGPPLLEASGFWGSAARITLLVALATMMLAVAELLAAGRGLARARAGRATSPLASRVAVGVALLLLALPCSVGLQSLERRLALERLRAEYVPLVLEQRARRSLALSATLRYVKRVLTGDAESVPVSSRPDFLAYYFWVTSDLFFSGYKSALDFYNASGEPVSHFGFDLPRFDEPVDLEADAATPSVEEETFEPVAAVRQRLLHAEVAVRSDGRLLGKVVGHVLDEPDNLPFLPGSRPYLAALGPAAPYGDPQPLGQLEYVLYDAPGTVQLSTLDQPPAMADVLVQAFDRDGRVDVVAGDESYVGLAVQDAYHRLHVLLVPARSALAHLAAAVRLALLAVGLLALSALAPLLVRPKRLATLWQGLRGSFYRKLLAALLAASMVPLVGMALFVRGYIRSRGQVALTTTAIRFAGAAQRVLDDYAATQGGAAGSDEAPLNDEIVSWLRSVIGQEIHVYENGLLQATSKRELFTAGLLPPRLDGQVQNRLGREGYPYVVEPWHLGGETVPVAYAPVQSDDPLRTLVVAVPVLGQQRLIERGVARVAEMVLLSTVTLAALLAVVAAHLARTVARPVRELVGATGRIAAGDYETRLEARTRDEVAELVRGFNSMAASLASQRADLERRREYIERLLRHATTGVISTNVEGRIVTLNPAASTLLSSARERPRVGEPLVEFLARRPEMQPLAHRLGRPLRQRVEPEEIDLDRAGEPRRLRLMRVELPDPGGGAAGRLILLDDVTDLMKSNQLAAWAEMARAIAHEIKNPLTPIQLSTEHLHRLLRDRGVLPAPELEACLETVKKQVRALYDIAGEFSAYAKLPALSPEPTDPVAFMRDVVGAYRTARLRGVILEERYEPAGEAAIDVRVLGRAVVNLIENALQAMPGGGRLTVGVSPAGGEEVVLWVEDTGVGLDREVRRRLFEPYFSTKSSGTGLGLAIVRRAVEAHQGRIEVDGAPGRGTRFRIYLRRARRPASSSAGS